MARKKSSSGSKGTSKAGPKDKWAGQLYDWISRGYDISSLASVMRTGRKAAIDSAFSEFSDAVTRLGNIREELEAAGFDEGHPAYDKVAELLNDPMRADELEDIARSISQAPRLKELKAELASLNTTGFEEDANRIRAMLDDGDDPDTVEAEIKKLRKRIKEKFFEEAFEEVAVTPERERFVAETIFLLHKDGTLLSVKSKKPPSQLDKKLMSRMVMSIKEQMSRAFKEGEHIHTLTYQGHNIILEESVHVYAAVVIVGEAKPVMYRVILKALQIMEKKLARELENWSGDRSSLENLDRYTTAIFQALDKLG